MPDRAVDTLMLPVHAPWCRTAELIDWVREVSPRCALALHDGELNPVGIAVIGGLLGEHGPGIPAVYRRLEPMQSCGV